MIAPSFGDIFRTNAIKIGLVPIVLGEAELDAVKRAVAKRNELVVDLEAQQSHIRTACASASTSTRTIGRRCSKA